MIDVENRLLRYFVAVAEAQNFARAAERLGITPQTLTPQIKKLESELGAKLLERKGSRKLVVTEAGQRVLADAREVLRRLEEMAARARQAGRGELGRLEIGFMTAVSCGGLLRKWIAGFQRANPGIKISTRKLIPKEQIAGIMREELDAGFTRALDKYPAGIRGIALHRQPMVLALPSDHPLARRKDIAPAMLKDESFVTIGAEPDVGFWGYTEAVAELGNFTPRVVRRGDDFISVLTHVALGCGIAVVPKLMRGVVPDVVFRNIAATQVPFTTIAFVYHLNSSPAATLLIKHLRRYPLPQQQTDPSAHNRIASWAAMEKEDELIAPPPIFAPDCWGSGIAHDGRFGES